MVKMWFTVEQRNPQYFIYLVFFSFELSSAIPVAFFFSSNNNSVKKPAGAVSIFGSVDLLGEMTKSIEEGGGTKKEAPPTSRKPRQRKSSSGSGLFGDMEEGEDDIFAFSGKKR